MLTEAFLLDLRLDKWFLQNAQVENQAYLRVILEDDGNVHVDDDEETNYKVRKEEGNPYCGRTTVAGITHFIVGFQAIFLVNYSI